MTVIKNPAASLETNPGTERISNILLVDDLPENLLTLESVLNNGSRKFLRAGSGNEALKIALREPLTLILMDIQMPDMDGLETTRLLRLNPKTRHIPVLFVSAIDPKEKLNLKEFEEGTVDFLFKPLNLSDTRQKVAFFEKMQACLQERINLRKSNETISKDFDRFVYMISHDLKAPLRAITNLTTWISEDLLNTGNQNIQENLTLLKDRVSRMNLMLDSILEYSRAGRMADEPSKVNTKQLVWSIFEGLQPSGSFRLNLEGTWPEVITRKVKLEKIFRHLIKNAIMHHDMSEGNLTIQCSAYPRHLVFTLSDDGPGIKPAYKETVFEMFQTLQSAENKNTPGAGLAIVKKIIEDHGGTISLHPHDPRGCTFVFSWPVQE